MPAVVEQKKAKKVAPKGELQEPKLPADQQLVYDAMNPAIALATEIHHLEFRKGPKLPYITHCFDVLKMVSDWGVTDLDIWQACMCHDVVESDPTLTKEKLIKWGLTPVASGYVMELTFIPDMKSPLTPQVQKAQYIDSFMNKSEGSLVVKLSDRASNTKDFHQSGEHVYAGKYWKKGSPLWEAALSRFHNNVDFETRFGPALLPNIKFTRDMINRMIVR